VYVWEPKLPIKAPDGSCRGSPPARLGVGIPRPARFSSEETRSDSAFALLSLGSRNHAHSSLDGLPHPSPSPVSHSIKRSGRRSEALSKVCFLYINLLNLPYPSWGIRTGTMVSVSGKVGPRTTPPLGCTRYRDNLLQDEALSLDDNSLLANLGLGRGFDNINSVGYK